MKLTEHWVMQWIKRDGLYLITLGLCLLAILSLSNGVEKATAECNEYWQNQWLEQNGFEPYGIAMEDPIYIGQPSNYIVTEDEFTETTQWN